MDKKEAIPRGKEKALGWKGIFSPPSSDQLFLGNWKLVLSTVSTGHSQWALDFKELEMCSSSDVSNS